jgi:hypothetical protein
MGWRFRHSFKIIPGVKLNLSKSGLSVSIGGAPVTLNVGPRGVYGTASVPGTGISFRQHLSNAPSASHAPASIPQNLSPSDLLPAPMPSPEPSSVPIAIPAPPVTTAPIEEVHSASTELLTSGSLQDLKKLIQTAYEERRDIESQLATARREDTEASAKYLSWKNGFLLKRLFKKPFAKRKADSETASAKVAELGEQLLLTTIATHIEIGKEQAEPFFRMRDDFASLTECAAIWDIKAHQATDQFRERTTATMRISRAPARLSLASCDLIQWEEKVPHLQNAKGGELFLYPGFILYRAAQSAFSVIDYHDVKEKAEVIKFYEEQGVPTDAKVIGQTWAKANKDGSPDKRFVNNRQIPIVAYGHMTLKSNSGLWEEFEFSNPERMARFAEAFNGFVTTFGTGAVSSPSAS